MIGLVINRISWISLLLVLASLAPCSEAAKHRVQPHYTFILPAEFVGWVQVIFNDRSMRPLPHREDEGYEIDIPESGICRTSDLRVEDSAGKDEFYYRTSSGQKEMTFVPSDYVLPGTSHGDFGVMDTGGKGPGYSWFIFIGPPKLRAQVPRADWSKVLEEYKKTHGGSARVESSEPYPVPGRISLPAPAQQ